MAGSCVLVLLKNRALGLAFQKAEQEAAGHLSGQPQRCTDRKPCTERGSDLPCRSSRIPPAPNPQLWPLNLVLWLSQLQCFLFLFFILSGPCFDRESTPYQFSNLTDSLGASSNAAFSRKLPWGLRQPQIAPFIRVPQPSTWPKYFLLLRSGDRCMNL